MRSWKIFGGKGTEGGQDQTDADDRSLVSTGSAGRPWNSPAGGGGAGSPNPRMMQSPSGRTVNSEGGFMGFMHGRYDSRMERNVSMAARNLGDGVQKIVMAAKGKQGSTGEWKSELLKLLGAGNDKSEIDILLENSSCDKFVLRCIENELPPNLIHCLRLLRVMELHHANEAHENGETEIKSIGDEATGKVSNLLCKLCTDPSVGEQLRPHLFGLLALSGASYPISGVHVAKAASDVIVAFSENCLSKQLVLFLRDRKMITHMTDDIKELCGITVANSNPAPLSLYGKDAEDAGLWAIALRTVISLVVYSCNHGCLDLLYDFERAGGYEVYTHALIEGTSKHGKDLIGLLPLLTCCTTSETVESGGEDAKMATNPIAFDVVDSVMLKYNPFVKAYDTRSNGQKIDFSREGFMEELVEFSLGTAMNTRFSEDKDKSSPTFDAATELLDITLQLYSIHPRNYEVLEKKHHVLTLFLLGFPTFKDENFKIFVLKTLEFVLTGVANTDAITPLHAAIEVFFAHCRTLLVDDELSEEIHNSLYVDAELMCGTMEKLLQFDHRVAPMFIELRIHATTLIEVLDLIMEAAKRRDFPTTIERNGKQVKIPPKSTPMDRTVGLVCRVLKLLVAQIPVDFSPLRHSSEEKDEEFSKLHLLLRLVMKEMGEDSAVATASVFEAKLSHYSSPDVLHHDLNFVLELIDYFGEMTAGALSIATSESAENSRLKSFCYRGVLLYLPTSNCSLYVEEYTGFTQLG